MKSRVVGFIKIESPRMDGRDRELGLNLSAGQEGLSLEIWLAALVGESTQEHGSVPRWEKRRTSPPSSRCVRANLVQLAEELDREYLELAAS